MDHRLAHASRADGRDCSERRTENSTGDVAHA